MAKKKVFQISSELTEGLEETISAAHSYSGELNIEIIPIKKIERDPENPRELAINFSDLPAGPSKDDPLYEIKLKDWESLRSMANSIEKEGVINPVVVYKFGDKYRLVAGERRTLASIIAGKQNVQAKVLTNKPTPLKLSLLQWAENVEREDLSLWERLRNLEKITSSYQTEGDNKGKMTPTILSEILGCSLPHAMNYHAILEANTILKQNIKENKIRNLEKAAFIAKVNEPMLKESVLNACIEGATLKELKAIVANEKQANIKAKKALSQTKGRGRQAIRVNLGATKKTSVIKYIIEAVLKTDKYDFLKDLVNKVEWDNYASVTSTFRQFLTILEKNEE
jgi:ParB family chromosome partitioning protein